MRVEAITDTCQTADDVIARARAVQARRRQMLIARPAAPKPEPELTCPVPRIFTVIPTLPPRKFEQISAHVGAVFSEQLRAPIPDYEPKLAPVLTTVRQIQSAVCMAAGITIGELLSLRRTRGVVKRRQIAMGLACLLTVKSLPEIGRMFGGKDHTTILHARNKMAPVLAILERHVGTKTLHELVVMAFDLHEQLIIPKPRGISARRATEVA